MQGVTNVKLTLGNGTSIYGELPISDYIVQEHNKQISQTEVATGKLVQRLGVDLAFDNWAYLLCSQIRENAHAY